MFYNFKKKISPKFISKFQAEKYVSDMGFFWNFSNKTIFSQHFILWDFKCLSFEGFFFI